MYEIFKTEREKKSTLISICSFRGVMLNPHLPILYVITVCQHQISYDLNLQCVARLALFIVTRFIPLHLSLILTSCQP